jgi:hypothetical protein
MNNLATAIKNESDDSIILMYACRTTSLALGCLGNSIEIMRDICEKFGGLMKMIVMMKAINILKRRFDLWVVKSK